MSMRYIDDQDVFICDNCGYRVRTSWGDCSVPQCNVCKGERGFVERLIAENQKLKSKLKKKMLKKLDGE